MSKAWVRSLSWLGAAVGVGLAARAYLKRKDIIDLRGQVVLVTGGSRGLGLVLARIFAEQGARVAICARQEEPLQLAREQLAARGAEVLAIACDVGDQAQVQRMVEQINEVFGRIDIVVNNAGIIMVGPQRTIRVEDYEACMKTMFWGTVYTSLAVLPQMRARGSGRIVNITSIGGKVSVPHLSAYSSAKFAALGFSEGLHAELASEGIKVISVVPGLMRTGSHINAFVKGQREKEYSLFGLAATLPLAATSVASAAQQIVRATQRGDAEVIITPQAQILGRFHGLFPGLTTEILGLVDRMLPDADDSAAEKVNLTGREVRSGPETLLTGLGEPAARETNQYARREE